MKHDRLHRHAAELNLSAVRDDLSDGCDPNAKARSGMTPMHWVSIVLSSADGSEVGVAEAIAGELVLSGANLDIPDIFGETPEALLTLHNPVALERLLILSDSATPLRKDQRSPTL